MFRAAQFFSHFHFPFTLWRYVYQFLVEGFLGIELPWDTQVGSNLQLQHGTALVVNHDTKIGSNCILRHSTTIGNKVLSDGSLTDSPIIGDYVEIGSNVVIIGSVKVGDYAVIGAGAVVVKDVPPRSVVAGNPAKVIRFLDDTSSDMNEPTVAASESSFAVGESNAATRVGV
jgi:putative colanic acid biosynthesis acetyltransferase WcaB